MKNYAMFLLVAAAAGLVALFVGRLGPSASTASSHREAPLISEDPTADNTDLYAFRSPDRPSTFTIVSNWIPGEDPAAGPNYYTLSVPLGTIKSRMFTGLRRLRDLLAEAGLDEPLPEL